MGYKMKSKFFLSMFEKSGKDNQKKNKHGNFTLYYAIRSDMPQLCVDLIIDGEDVNGIRRKDGVTPLMAAASQGKMECMNVLIANGADLEIRDLHGKRAISYAAYNGELEICRTLIDKGSKIDGKDGMDFIEDAVSGGNIDLCELFLEKGGDKNIFKDFRDYNNFNLMLIAVLSIGKYEKLNPMVFFLIDQGVDVDYVDDCGKNSLYYAELKARHDTRYFNICTMMSQQSKNWDVLRANPIQNTQDMASESSEGRSKVHPLPKQRKYF